MKHALIFGALALLASEALHASTMISCAPTSATDANTVNTCYASHLSDFQTNLQWDNLVDALSNPVPVDGTAHSTTWYGSTALGTVSVTGANMYLRANYEATQLSGGLWLNIQDPHYAHFNGTFDAPPDTTPDSAVMPGYPGDFLIGTTNTLTISSGAVGMANFGFRVASQSNTAFDMVLSLFASTDGSGPALETHTFISAYGGGTCAGLATVGGAAPTPCNTAPFFAVTGTEGVHSFTVSVNDPNGFYIDTLQLNDNPEPASLLLTGFGLASLVGFARRRKQTSRSTGQ